MIDRVSRTTIDHEGKHCTWTAACPYMESGCGQSSCDCDASDSPASCEVVEIDGQKVWALKVDVENAVAEIVPTSQVTAAANAAGFYGDDAVRFAREVDNATEFLIGRVAASGGDKRRFGDRRSRARLREECLRQAGVPEQYWPPEGLLSKLGRAVVVGIKVALTWSKYSVPLPWNIVIAAVVLAVERYLGGGNA